MHADDSRADAPTRGGNELVRRSLLWALIIVAARRRPASWAGSYGSSGRSTRAAHEAQQAAVQYAQVLTSIDSNNVDQNFAQVLDGATGEFKDMYTQSSAQLRQLLVDNKATARGVVLDSAVQVGLRRTRSSCCCSSTKRWRTRPCPIRGSTAAGSR